MKKELLRKVFVAAIIATACTLNICAKAILPYGQFEKEPWQAKYFYALDSETGVTDNWYATDFDDSEWSSINGPICNTGCSYIEYYATPWPNIHSTYWVRRNFTIDSISADKFYTLPLIYDDYCEVYINGELIYSDGSYITTTKTITLTDEMVSNLKKGNNLIAVRTSDTGAGDSYIDFGLYEYSAEDFLFGKIDTETYIDNDKENPWTPDVTNNCFTNGNCGKSNTNSAMSLIFESGYKTEISFDWLCYNYSQHSLAFYIDGEQKATTTNSSYQTVRFILDAGKHTITFRDSIGNNSSTYNYSRIKDLRIKEASPIENVVLTGNSKKITFENNSSFPWIVEDGYIQNSNYGHANSASSFSTTFTIEKASKLSFERQVTPYNEYWVSNTGWVPSQKLYMIIDEETHISDINVSDFTKYSIVLEPGTHTIEWLDTIENSTASLYSRIRNIEVSSDWIEITLEAAGTLGTEVLRKVNVLTDVELLKIKGALNADDWANIKQMKNLLGLDLSEAQITSVPDYAFDGMSFVASVKLPEGVNTIGKYAFRDTNIWQIKIPSTVTTIEEYAFANSHLAEITFPFTSRLKSIKRYAFYNCTSLKEFIMPGTVTDLGDGYNFQDCRSLNRIIFSDSVTNIPNSTCNRCYQLREFHLPNNLKSIGTFAFGSLYYIETIDFPESLTTIGDYAFEHLKTCEDIILPNKLTSLGYCAFENGTSIKNIVLPSYVESYNRAFGNCSNIKTLTCNSATPPTNILNDPFFSVDKATVALKVPTFAVVDYKLDNYWYQFGAIEGGADNDYYKITDQLALTNNLRIEGKPAIDIYYGGKLTVSGNAPMTTGTLNFFINNSNPGTLLNNSDITADSINTYFAVEANRWYFLTPLHDINIGQITHSAEASFIFRYYDAANRAANGTGNNWKNVTDSKLLAGKGYIFQCTKNGTITLPAKAGTHAQLLSSGDVATLLTAHATETAANKNWNYVGNPYPTYYDIYHMGFTAPITVWTGNTYKAYSIADDELALCPMQSFFVQKPEGVDSIVFHKEGRQLTSTIERRSDIKARNAATAAPRFLFNMQIAANDTLIDETRVVINENASTSYEMQSDASKFMSLKSEVPQIFTLDGEGCSYAINERPLADGSVVLGYNVSRTGFYTISATSADGKIELTDKLLNRSVDLTQESYLFHSGATAGNNTTRFTLRVTLDNNGLTSIDAPTEAITVTAGKGVLNIVASKNTAYTIYTTDGRTVAAGETDAATAVTLPAGTYIVKVNDKTFKAIVF